MVYTNFSMARKVVEETHVPQPSIHALTVYFALWRSDLEAGLISLPASCDG